MIQSFFRSLYLKNFFSHLYQTYLDQGWSVIAKAPTYLNVALPDFSVQYIVASFHKGDSIIIEGKVPKASYVSLVVYDTYGIPYSYIYLNRESKTFRVETGKELSLPKGSVYAIIMRIYELEGKFIYPTIVKNGYQIESLPQSKIYKNSLEISTKVIQILSKTLHLNILPSQPFFKPIRAQKRGLFINPDAVYLVASPKKDFRVMIITGKLPPKRKDLCFVGFMACNLKTTETDDSISWKDLPSSYRIFVSNSKSNALLFGFRPHSTDRLLLWKSTNDDPIVIYREVNLNHKGIFGLDSEKWEDAKKIMKSCYPEVENV